MLPPMASVQINSNSRIPNKYRITVKILAVRRERASANIGLIEIPARFTHAFGHELSWALLTIAQKKRHRAAALHDAGAMYCTPLLPRGRGVRQPYAA